MLIGIDQGTSGTTCAAFDEELNVVASSYRPLANYFPRPGWVEQDAYEILDSVSGAVADVLNQVDDASRIVAAGVANQGETVLPWDAKTGEALSPAIVWSDKRSTSIVERLSAKGQGSRVAELTGLRLSTYFCASKYAWLLENVPAVQEAHASGTLRLGTLDSWLAWRLSNEARMTDEGTASRTQLMALGARSWSEELLAVFDVPNETLATIRPTMADFGVLAQADWNAALPWRASVVDQAAALAGHGCFSEGEMKVTYGTGSFVVIHGGQSHRAPPDGLLTMVAWSDRDGRTYAVDGGVFTAGTAIKWLQSVGIIRDADECAALAEESGGASGVRFLPALSGLGSPWPDDASRGAFTGLTAGTTSGQLVAAVLDSIAFRVRDILEAAWNDGYPRPAKLRVDGGLTRNRYLMQRQADILGLPLERPASLEATALGAAALAGIAAGFLTESEVRSRVAGGDVTEPRQSASERDEEYEAWRTWLRACRTNRALAGES